MDTPAAESMAPQVVFRPGKKRKPYRQRAEDREPTTDQAASAIAEPQNVPSSGLGGSEDDGGQSTEEGLPVAEALRLRNARKSKLRGVEFRREGPSRADATKGNAERGLVLRDIAADDGTSVEPAGRMATRFTAQTGLIGELVNKHMEEYIESELARRNLVEPSQPSSRGPKADQEASDREPRASKRNPVEGQPTVRGKLQEVDLGDETRARNIAMTERATRRLQGESIDDDDNPQKSKKVRLGRDGKPWRPRNRRGSDDVKRDQMVEQFLHENRLDVYDMPAQQDGGPASDEEEEAADDRIAEEFRRDFMEAMSQRIKRKRTAAPPAGKHGQKKTEEVLKGPKLGGSRNSRAAMRDLLLKKEQEKSSKR